METWKTINDYPNYEVSNYGQVRNKTTQKLMKPRKSTNGYLIVDIRNEGEKKTCTIHRLVGKAFIPNCDNKQEIDHIDNNPHNNAVINLRWVSSHENTVRQQRMQNAKNICWIENKKIYKIQYQVNGKRYQKYAKTLEDAEALLIIMKALDPHKIL